MRRLIVILAAIWFLALGTGAAEYVHDAQHAHEDAADAASHIPSHDEPNPIHDDSNCPMHAQLHQPLLVTPVVLLLIAAGLLVAFVSQLAPRLDSIRIPARIDCRGPPPLV